MLTMGGDKALPPDFCREQQDMIANRGFCKTRPGFNRFDPTAQGVSTLGPLGLFQSRRKNGQWSTISFSDDGKMYDWPQWVWDMTLIGSLTSPQYVAYDPVSEYYYITDNISHRIIRMKEDGSDYDTYGSSGSGDDQFNQPTGIFWDSVSSSLFIADRNNKRIVNTKWDGVGWDTVDLPDNRTPWGIHYDSGSEFVYMTQYLGNRLSKIKMDGTGWVEYGSAGSGVGNFDEPRDITYDGSEFLYVTDHDNNRIAKLDDTLVGGSGWDTYDLPAGYNDPWGLQYDSSGYIYYSDRDNNLLVKTKWDGVGFASIPLTGYNVQGVYYNSTSKFLHTVGSSTLIGVKF